MRSIINKKMMKDKKGTVIFDLIIWIIISFITLLFFAVWIYGWGVMTTQLTASDITAGSVNVTEAAEKTFGEVDDAIQTFRWLATVIIVTLAISILVSNYFIKVHPLFFGVYVFILILSIVFAAYVSNAYGSLLPTSPLGDQLFEFTGGNFIMLNLPIWVTVIGIFGAIMLFAGIIRQRESGGGIV